jgi:GntR family transcriptional regulator
MPGGFEVEIMDSAKGGSVSQTYDQIDRQSAHPIYAQLADVIRQQISEGVYRPGDQLPSEAMLVRTYRVSPMTVRRAINLLADQEVVSTAQGRGTFVKQVELATAAFDLRGIKALFSSDSATTIKLLDGRIIKADARTARKLQVKKGDTVIYIRRLIEVDGEPAFYHRGYLLYDPARPVVESELEVTELRCLFEGQGSILIKRGELTLEASIMNEEEARILKITLPSPAMLLEHIFYDFDDRPISWGTFICQAKRLRLQTEVGLK